MPEFEPSHRDARAHGTTPGGRLMADALRDAGVDTIFALCGGHILGLLDACMDVGIRVVDTRHEGAASFGGLGWALATGRTGVTAVTAGPGFGNALTGFMDASLGNAPLLLFAGRTGLNQAGRGAVMDIDQRAMVEPIAKWARSCTDTDRIGEFVREALFAARSGCPGPAYLEIPQDVFMAGGEAAQAAVPPGRPAEPPTPSPDPADIERALTLLAQAERPIVIAGSGAFWSGAAEDLTLFASRSAIPVTTTSAARGLLPDSACLGSMVHGGLAVSQADVVLVLGSAFNANLMFGRPPLFGHDQHIIQVDIDPGRLGGQRLPDVAIVGDVSRVLRALTDGWSGKAPARAEWLEQCATLAAFGRAIWDQQIDSWSGPRVHAGAAARELAAFAGEVGPHTFVADGGDALTWALAYARAEAPGRLLSTTTALGSLGVGLPFAIAAGAARPAEPVFCFIGDGTFGLCAMEFDTAVRHGIPLVVVVSNNAGWRDVSHEQDMWFGPGRTIASELGDSRYDKLADALGGHGEDVDAIDGLRPALKRALDAGVPSIINVRTDPGVLSELLRNMGTLGLM